MQWMPRLAAVLLSSLVALPAVGQTVYSNTFTNGAGGGQILPGVTATWSATNTEVTPSGRHGRFLGQFGAGTVSLTLTGLPSHRQVSVGFNLFIIGSWDGNHPEAFFGPDLWSLSVSGGPTLLNTTFNNHTDTTGGDAPWTANGQSFPLNYPGRVRSKTGAVESNTLGYEYGGPKDAVYFIGRTFNHTGSSLTILFSAPNLQPIDDESWGLDNIFVTTHR